MNIFRNAKAAITPRQAAQHYGLSAEPSGMAHCIFHDDRHPSMKLNDTYFYCFSCHTHGDVIDLVAQLFHESPYDAAKRLASDFCILAAPQQKSMEARPLTQPSPTEERLCFSILMDYEQCLQQWKKAYAPTDPEEEPDERYVLACYDLPYISSLVDIWFQPDKEQQQKLAQALLQDGTLVQILKRMTNAREE